MRGTGKAHKSGLGAQLMQRVNGGAKAASHGRGHIGQYAHLFTTNVPDGRGAMQSVLDVSDLDEVMALAELAGRSFAAERQNVTVVTLGGPDADEQAAKQAAQRRMAAHTSDDRLTVPRRPPWRSDMAVDELDRRERESFLIWRRDLAALEETEGVHVTPFEKNLEVWRQLWRVLERSDLVCQVVDARDPLRYRCPDLEAYVDELGAGAKHHLLLLNKADLLPVATRRAWAAYFEEQDIDFIFWSALAATETRTEEVGYAVTAPLPDTPPPPPAGMVRTGARVVGRDELLRLLEARAAAAAMCVDDEDEDEEGGSEGGGAEGDADPRFGSTPRRVVVGLVGYPNVGKSSTLNALVGAKRTGVGSTPGKTKHFQTFNISDSLQLADCPGLVFPSTSDGRAELVAAGVLPIDKLTDVVGPIDVVARRVPRAQLERLYALRLPRPAMHEDQHRAPTGRELLRGYAASRGLTSGAGLPDETRAGRASVKDYTSGKLLFYEWPPGMQVPEGAEEEEEEDESPSAALRRAGGEEWSSEEEEEGDDDEEEEGGSGEEEEGDGPAVHQHQQQRHQRVLSPPSMTSSAAVGDALLGELRALGLAGGDKKDRAGVVRAPHKLQKKGKKEKLRRLARGPMAPEGIGGMLITGRRGGLMPASVQVAPTPEFLPALLRNSAGIASGGARERTTSARTAIPQPANEDDGEDES